MQLGIPRCLPNPVLPTTRANTPARTVAAILAGWELAAVLSGMLPTISATWWKYRDHHIGRVVLGVLWSYLTWHLWTQKSSPASRTA